jgi:hypothetical protein
MPTKQKQVRRMALFIKVATDEDIHLVKESAYKLWSTWSWLAIKKQDNGIIILSQNQGRTIDAIKAIRDLKPQLPAHLQNIKHFTSPKDPVVLKTRFEFEYGKFRKAGEYRKKEISIDNICNTNEDITLDEMDQDEDDIIREECESVLFGMLNKLEADDHDNNPDHMYPTWSCVKCSEMQAEENSG